MQFTPQTEEELDKEGLFEKGEYPFEVQKATDKTSAGGNEMIEVVQKIFKDDGSQNLVYDYLSASFMKHKLKHFCEATGLQTEYKNGEVKAHMLEGKTGKSLVDFEPASTNKETGKSYKAKNTITDYVVPEGQKIEDDPIKDDKVDMDDKDEDEIPF